MIKARAEGHKIYIENRGALPLLMIAERLGERLAKKYPGARQIRASELQVGDRVVPEMPEERDTCRISLPSLRKDSKKTRYSSTFTWDVLASEPEASFA